MAAPIPGFPDRFPVRDDGVRPWRYRIVCGGLWIFFRTLFGGRLHIKGVERIPAQGPLVVAANHLSAWDPLLFGAVFPGTLFAMAKREIFRPAVVAWVVAGCNSFPVDRGHADRRALRIAMDVLNSGQRLLVFIEGTRGGSEGMGRAESGAGFLVRRTGARVVPVAVWGTESLIQLRPWPRRGHIWLRYGEPFTVTATDDSGIANEIGTHIAALLPRKYRGFYAGDE